MWDLLIEPQAGEPSPGQMHAQFFYHLRSLVMPYR
jgi:hypothetical protein